MDEHDIIEIDSSSGSVYNCLSFIDLVSDSNNSTYPSFVDLVFDSNISTGSVNAPHPRSRKTRSKQPQQGTGSFVRDNFGTHHLSDSEGSHVGESAESRISGATSRNKLMSQEECVNDVYNTYGHHLTSAEHYVWVTSQFVEEKYRRLYSSYSYMQRLAWIDLEIEGYKKNRGKDAPPIRPEDAPDYGKRG